MSLKIIWGCHLSCGVCIHYICLLTRLLEGLLFPTHTHTGKMTPLATIVAYSISEATPGGEMAGLPTPVTCLSLYQRPRLLMLLKANGQVSRAAGTLQGLCAFRGGLRTLPGLLPWLGSNQLRTVCYICLNQFHQQR